jgi:hypothetical protein
MEEIEYLHGASAPGSHWLLLCRGSGILFAGHPISYDNPYMDMIKMYRQAADTAMAIEDTAGIARPHPRAVSKAWGVTEKLATALHRYEGRHPNPRLLIAIMTRKFEGLTKWLDEGYLKDMEAATECRMANMLVQDVFTHGAYEIPKPLRHLIVAYSDIATPPRTAEPPGARHARWYMRREVARGGSSAYHMRVVCNGTSHCVRAASPYMDRNHHPIPTRPMMAMAQQVSEVWWIRGSETTGRERRWADHLLREVHIRRDPEVQREGNDVTQAAFQSPTAHPVRTYERMIYSRHNVSSVFRKEEGGHPLAPVQRTLLGRDNFPALTTKEMFGAGMFLQQGVSEVPTGNEYQGVGRQGDFDPYAEGPMAHADCYLIINGKKGHSVRASFFGDAEKCLQHRAIVRGFNDIQGLAPVRVRAARMIAELPEATNSPFIPQDTFINVYGAMVDAEQALEVAAREYMDSEYRTGGDRGESVVTPLLIIRWRQVHDDMIRDAAWVAIFRHDHRDHGECKPDLTMIDPEEREQRLDDAYLQLALHLEIPGFTLLLEAQEGRTVRQANTAIQSKLSEHIRSTDYQRRQRRVAEYNRRDIHRSHVVAQLSDPAEYVDTGDAGRGGNHFLSS